MPFTGPVVEQTASIEIDVFVKQCFYCVLWWIVFHGKSAVGFFMCWFFYVCSFPLVLVGNKTDLKTTR